MQSAGLRSPLCRLQGHKLVVHVKQFAMQVARAYTYVHVFFLPPAPLSPPYAEQRKEGEVRHSYPSNTSV